MHEKRDEHSVALSSCGMQGGHSQFSRVVLASVGDVAIALGVMSRASEITWISRRCFAQRTTCNLRTKITLVRYGRGYSRRLRDASAPERREMRMKYERIDQQRIGLPQAKMALRSGSGCWLIPEVTHKAVTFEGRTPEGFLRPLNRRRANPSADTEAECVLVVSSNSSVVLVSHGSSHSTHVASIGTQGCQIAKRQLKASTRIDLNEDKRLIEPETVRAKEKTNFSKSVRHREQVLPKRRRC